MSLDMPKIVADANVSIALGGLDPDTGRRLTERRRHEMLAAAAGQDIQAIHEAIARLESQLALLREYADSPQ